MTSEQCKMCEMTPEMSFKVVSHSSASLITRLRQLFTEHVINLNKLIKSNQLNQWLTLAN